MAAPILANMRVILYTGKGGVGKTTIAAATAVLCAQRGLKTLVMSTDAAHSLGDSLDREIGPEPIQISENLWAQEINALHEMEGHWEKIHEYLATLFNSQGVGDIIAEELATPPGMEEVASLMWIRRHSDAGQFDVLVVDEAYQCTHALFSAAAAGFTQVLMVGDPGQIGPVVTVDTSIWQGQKDGPHLRAPEVLAEYTDIERFALDTTWRLGPISAAAVAPIYKFSFTSGADHRMCVSADGEIHSEIESIEIAHVDTVDDLDAMLAVADRVSALVGATLVTTTGQRSAADSDIAVIVSRNSQVSILSGLLQQRMLPGVTIGTADKLQGGEWPIVVALDPFVGSQSDSEHNTSIGRLCVMASRHITHLSWMHDDSWVEMTKGRTASAKTNRAVRAALTSNPIQSPTSN